MWMWKCLRHRMIGFKLNTTNFAAHYSYVTLNYVDFTEIPMEVSISHQLQISSTWFTEFVQLQSKMNEPWMIYWAHFKLLFFTNSAIIKSVMTFAGGKHICYSDHLNYKSNPVLSTWLNVPGMMPDYVVIQKLWREDLKIGSWMMQPVSMIMIISAEFSLTIC